MKLLKSLWMWALIPGWLGINCWQLVRAGYIEWLALALVLSPFAIINLIIIGLFHFFGRLQGSPYDT